MPKTSLLNCFQQLIYHSLTVDVSIKEQCFLPLCSPLPEQADCAPRDAHTHNSQHCSVSEAGGCPPKAPSQDISQQGGEASPQHQGERSRRCTRISGIRAYPQSRDHIWLYPQAQHRALCVGLMMEE